MWNKMNRQSQMGLLVVLICLICSALGQTEFFNVDPGAYSSFTSVLSGGGTGTHAVFNITSCTCVSKSLEAVNNFVEVKFLFPVPCGCNLTHGAFFLNVSDIDVVFDGMKVYDQYISEGITNQGAGLTVRFPKTTTATFSLGNSTFRNNTADWGSSVFLENPYSWHIEDTEFRDGRSRVHGAAIAVIGSNPTLNDAEISVVRNQFYNHSLGTWLYFLSDASVDGIRVEVSNNTIHRSTHNFLANWGTSGNITDEVGASQSPEQNLWFAGNVSHADITFSGNDVQENYPVVMAPWEGQEVRSTGGSSVSILFSGRVDNVVVVAEDNYFYNNSAGLLGEGLGCITDQVFLLLPWVARGGGFGTTFGREVYNTTVMIRRNQFIKNKAGWGAGGYVLAWKPGCCSTLDVILEHNDFIEGSSEYSTPQDRCWYDNNGGGGGFTFSFDNQDDMSLLESHVLFAVRYNRFYGNEGDYGGAIAMMKMRPYWQSFWPEANWVPSYEIGLPSHFSSTKLMSFPREKSIAVDSRFGLDHVFPRRDYQAGQGEFSMESETPDDLIVDLAGLEYYSDQSYSGGCMYPFECKSSVRYDLIGNDFQDNRGYRAVVHLFVNSEPCFTVNVLDNVSRGNKAYAWSVWRFQLVYLNWDSYSIINISNNSFVDDYSRGGSAVQWSCLGVLRWQGCLNQTILLTNNSFQHVKTPSAGQSAQFFAGWAGEHAIPSGSRFAFYGAGNEFVGSSDGGALSVMPGAFSSTRITLEENTFIGCVAKAFGGGSFWLWSASGLVTFGDIIVRNNYVRNSSALGSGGGIYLQYSYIAAVEHLIEGNQFIENNCSASGGGLRINAFSLMSTPFLLRNNLFDSNIAFRGGGFSAEATTAGSLDWAKNVSCDFTFENNTFVNNSVNEAAGGLHFCGGARVAVSECVFLDNFARSTGGALYVVGQVSMQLVRSTFLRNSAVDGGAVVHLILSGVDVSREYFFVVNNTFEMTYGSQILISSLSGLHIDYYGGYAHCPFGSHYATADYVGTSGKNCSFNASHPVMLQCEDCHGDTYLLQDTSSLPGGNHGCKQCPGLLQCLGEGKVAALPGFYVVEGEDEKLGGAKAVAIACSVGYCCDDVNVCQKSVSDDVAACANNRRNFLCGDCKEGYSAALSGPQCLANSKCKAYGYLFSNILMSFFYVLFIVVTPQGGNGIFKVATYYFQILPYVRPNLQESQSAIREGVLGLVGVVADLASASFIKGVSSSSCAFKNMTSTGQIFLMLFGPSLMMIFFTVFCCCHFGISFRWAILQSAVKWAYFGIQRAVGKRFTVRSFDWQYPGETGGVVVMSDFERPLLYSFRSSIERLFIFVAGRLSVFVKNSILSHKDGQGVKVVSSSKEMQSEGVLDLTGAEDGDDRYVEMEDLDKRTGQFFTASVEKNDDDESRNIVREKTSEMELDWRGTAKATGDHAAHHPSYAFWMWRWSQQGRYTYAFVTLVLLMYRNVADVTLNLINCKRYPDYSPSDPDRKVSVLYRQGTLRCWQWWQIFFLLFAIFFVFPFPFHLGAYRKSVRAFYRKLRKVNIPPRHAAALYCLENPFRRHRKFWESVLMFRRLMVITFASTITSPFTNSVMVCLTCAIILLSHLIAHPYSCPYVSFVESISLFSLLMLSVFKVRSGTVVSIGSVETSGSVKNAYFWVEFCLSLLIVFLIFFLVVRQMLGRAVGIGRAAGSQILERRQKASRDRDLKDDFRVTKKDIKEANEGSVHDSASTPLIDSSEESEDGVS